jgi:hypothetical protein
MARPTCKKKHFSLSVKIVPLGPSYLIVSPRSWTINEPNPTMTNTSPSITRYQLSECTSLLGSSEAEHASATCRLNTSSAISILDLG